MGEKYHIGRAAGVSSLVVVVSEKKPCLFILFSRNPIISVSVCFGIYIAPLPREEKHATIAARRRLSMIM